MVKRVIKNEEKLKSTARKISTIEAASYSVSDGFGFRNVTPFLLEIGKSSSNINMFVSFLSSIPGLLASTAQVFSARLVEKYSRRQIVSISVFLQAFMWLVLLVPGIMYFYFQKDSEYSSILLIIIYSLLVLFGAISGPAWSSWMKDIVSENRGSYFANRSRIAGTVSFVFAIIGGFLLDYFKQTKIFVAFIILFSFSFIFRSISGFLFTKQYEPKFKLTDGYYFSFWEFFKKMRFNNFGRFTIFISLVSFSVAISSPFFAVYMLRDLNFSYIQYFIVTLISSVVTLVCLPFWGKFADKYGSFQTMKLTGLFISLVPLFWIPTMFFRGNLVLLFSYLFITETISGFVWSGFNLASGNFIYFAFTRERIGICSSYFNLLNSFGAFFGAILGGLLAYLHFSFFFSSLLFVFIVSGLVRWLVYSIMINKFQEVIPVSTFSLKDHLLEKFEDLALFFSGLKTDIFKIGEAE
jgi:MFS family permease